MPEVSMSLAELDALREEIKNLKIDKSNLEKSVSDIKADKRTIKIKERVETQCNYNSHHVSEAIRYCSRYGRSTNLQEVVQQVFEQISISYYGLGNDKIRTSIEYINFDDAKLELRAQIESEMDTEFAELKQIKKKLDADIASLKATHKQELSDIIKKFDTDRKSYKDIIDELTKSYDDLKHDKDTRKKEQILEDKIKELTEKLATEQNKKWYQKVF